MSTEPPHLDKQEKTVLPGFGLPLNDTNPASPNSKTFPNALNPMSYLQPARVITTRELKMLQIMDEITSKPGWEEEMLHKTISSKWRKNILDSKIGISELMLEYMLDELQYKAQVFAATSIITVFDSGVVKSDTIVPKEIKAALQEAAKPLENVPEDKKDWHPGPDGEVLDLVDPSLFPLMYGQSRILPEGRMGIVEGLKLSGKGVVLPVPPEEDTKIPYGFAGLSKKRKVFSNKFQWLPCEVDIQGEKAKVTSYINNLHPNEHGTLYGLIEQLINYSIPLWDMALTPLQDLGAELMRIEYKVPEYDPDYEALVESDDSDDEHDEEYRDNEIHRCQRCQITRTVVQPEPSKKFAPPTVQNPVRLREQYREQGLQVIVKLANIMLTPEKPAYNGRASSVEGQMNEHIVASALYYYSSENTSTSKLAFRQECDLDVTEMVCDRDHSWLPEVFGLENNKPTVQILGGVKTPEGRLLAFPNTLQHLVQPFTLKDPTKPGHQKIVALFLVDPNIKVISTANVPCQRKDWWREELEANGALGKLPLELRDQVVEDMEFPIEIEVAKKLREELMVERKLQQDAMLKSFDLIFLP